MPECLLCSQIPCSCKCEVCGAREETSYYPDADGGVEAVSNLELDSFPLDTEFIDSKLLKKGWKHQLIDSQHFRVRTTCRNCLIKLEDSREVWQIINRERKSKDSDAKQPDNFYGLLVGAEGEGSNDSNFWKHFQD